MNQQDSLEKSPYDKTLYLLEQYPVEDTEVLPEKVVAEIEQLKTALEAEKTNASQTIESIYHALAKLTSEGKLKGSFVVGSEKEFDYYDLSLSEQTPITLILIPAANDYEWKVEEGLQFGVDALPPFDVLHKDLAVLKKSNLLPRLFNATQADTRNPAAIEKLEALLLANTERKNKALVTQWRETLEYVLTDLKDEKTGKSILVDQEFTYSKNGKTKAYKIIKADRTGIVVLIDEELELDRKFHIDTYAYELITAFLPVLKKHQGKSPAAKPASRNAKTKKAAKSPETSLPADTPESSTSVTPGEAEKL